MGEARSFSVDEGGGWNIPIKVESAAKPRVFSPQSRSISIDQQAYKHDGTPPSKSFGVRQTEPFREIPVQLERKHTSDNLRQIPINIETAGTSSSPKQIHIERERKEHPQIQVPIYRDSTSHDIKKTDTAREIPIKRELKQEPIEAPNPFRREMLASDIKSPPSYHTDITDTYDERVITPEDRQRAELKRKQMELKRDIDNVIHEAIRQVPVYQQNKLETEIKPRTLFPRQASVDEVITPRKVESPRQQRVDHALQQDLDKDQKVLIQKRWEQEKRVLDERQRHMEEKQRQLEERQRQTAAGSYATLPIKKQSSVDVASVEQEPGSYSTLPSYRLKTSKGPGSPQISRSYDHDHDRHYFSDAETTRRTPTWRPVASPLAKRSGFRPSTRGTYMQSDNVWTPSSSPGLEKKIWSPSPAPPSTHTSVDLMPAKGRSMHADNEYIHLHKLPQQS